MKFAHLIRAVSLFCLCSFVAFVCCLSKEAGYLRHCQRENLDGKAGQDSVRFLLMPNFRAGHVHMS